MAIVFFIIQQVKEWASQLESGDAQSKENALMNLRNIKEQLLAHSIAETQLTPEQEQNADKSMAKTSDKSVADNRSIGHKKGGLFGCFSGQNGNNGHHHHGTAGRDRTRERDEHNAALYGAALVGFGIGAAGCGGAGCGGGCGSDNGNASAGAYNANDFRHNDNDCKNIAPNGIDYWNACVPACTPLSLKTCATTIVSSEDEQGEPVVCRCKWTACERCVPLEEDE
ncbi:hypothetical protein niasHT_010840 [Heterodera trifolii]|uniref:Uncharacterized protein n=1 Tax=Heterodera trifolii TaxID=157864 RepID=A0ABD2LCX1_9BILA